jgi:hypothetical protein
MIDMKWLEVYVQGELRYQAPIVVLTKIYDREAGEGHIAYLSEESFEELKHAVRSCESIWCLTYSSLSDFETLVYAATDSANKLLRSARHGWCHLENSFDKRFGVSYVVVDINNSVAVSYLSDMEDE